MDSLLKNRKLQKTKTHQQTQQAIQHMTPQHDQQMKKLMILQPIQQTIQQQRQPYHHLKVQQHRNQQCPQHVTAATMLTS